MKTKILINLIFLVSLFSFAQRSNKPWKNGRDRETNQYNFTPNNLNLKKIRSQFEKINHNKLSSKYAPIVNQKNKTFEKANGINIAWINYGRDTGVNPNGGDNFRPDLEKFEEVMDFVSANDGNVIRWWYHTNGSTNPVFDNNQMVAKNPNFFHNDVKAILNLAQQKGIKVQICLWSFDMLKDQWAVDAVANKKLLTQNAYTKAYINNALLPLVNAIGNHPALYAWEIFNEPEGMTKRYADHWPGFLQKIEMKDIQSFINKVSGAIRKAQPKVKITNGALGFLTNVEDPEKGFWNAYTDINLIQAGGDLNGYLDFYNIHYYKWAGINGSPFHNAFDTSKIDKPTVIGEYYPDNLVLQGTPNIDAKNLGKKLNENSWQGSIVWSWTDRTNITARNNMASIISGYNSEIQNTLVADAGKDQSYNDSDNDGQETISLDGSKSSYTGSKIKSFVWKNKGKVIGTGAKINTTLPLGTHNIKLVITNHENMTATDVVTIIIEEDNAGPPVVVDEKLEAESAMILSKVEIKSDGSTSNGAYVYMKGDNGKITWGFDVPSDGDYSVDFRYNVPFGFKKQFLNVNTSYIGEIDFNGPQNTWQTKTMTLNLKAGFNTVTLTASWGYMYFDFITIKTEKSATETSNDPFLASSDVFGKKKKAFAIYPIPAKNHLTVKGSELGDKIKVFDTYGNIILESTLNLHQESIDVSSLKKGTYIIQVSNKGRQFLIKE